MKTTHKEVTPDTDVAIRWLLARYCQLVDDGDLDAAAALFAEDARLRVGEENLDGRTAIRSWLDSVPAGLCHQVTNIVASNGSREGTVHAVSDLVVARKEGGNWATLMVGRYHDTLVGTGRSMTFSQRIVTVR